MNARVIERNWKYITVMRWKFRWSGTLILFVVVLSAGVLGPVSAPGAAASECVAFGSSNGVEAEVVGQCSTAPDDLHTDPLHCDEVSFHLVIEDDLEFAVLGDQVVRGYDPAPEPGREGYDAHHGAIHDVLGFDGQVTFVGPAFLPDFGPRRFSSTGRWWSRTCWSRDPETGLSSVDSIDGPFPEGEEMILEEIIAVARAKVQPVAPPPVVHSGPTSVMQLPTWWWVERPWWDTTNRGEHSHGLVSVAVEAFPTRWTLMAEPNDLLTSCEGPGEEWAPGSSDELGCTSTFLDPVERGSLVVDLTVELEVYWTSSIPGYGVQQLPSIVLSTASDHTVIEVAGLRSG